MSLPTPASPTSVAARTPAKIQPTLPTHGPVQPPQKSAPKAALFFQPPLPTHSTIDVSTMPLLPSSERQIFHIIPERSSTDLFSISWACSALARSADLEFCVPILDSSARAGSPRPARNPLLYLDLFCVCVHVPAPQAAEPYQARHFGGSGCLSSITWLARCCLLVAVGYLRNSSAPPRRACRASSHHFCLFGSHGGNHSALLCHQALYFLHHHPCSLGHGAVCRVSVLRQGAKSLLYWWQSKHGVWDLGLVHVLGWAAGSRVCQSWALSVRVAVCVPAAVAACWSDGCCGPLAAAAAVRHICLCGSAPAAAVPQSPEGSQINRNAPGQRQEFARLGSISHSKRTSLA
eukprot:m.166207 g.166207  ORF g.166207 m.166207 type:complete len:348 (-) comp53141_c0_seq2:736-1779(-)